MNRTSKEYKIQCYLRLAELCNSDEDEKRRLYMTKAEELLDSKAHIETTIEHSHELEFFENSITDFCKIYDNFLYQKVSDIYKKYTEFCLSNGIQKSFSKIEFSRQICKMLNLKTKPKKICGDTYRVYVRKR